MAVFGMSKKSKGRAKPKGANTRGRKSERPMPTQTTNTVYKDTKPNPLLNIKVPSSQGKRGMYGPMIGMSDNPGKKGY